MPGLETTYAVLTLKTVFGSGAEMKGNTDDAMGYIWYIAFLSGAALTSAFTISLFHQRAQIKLDSKKSEKLLACVPRPSMLGGSLAQSLKVFLRPRPGVSSPEIPKS